MLRTKCLCSVGQAPGALSIGTVPASVRAERDRLTTLPKGGGAVHFSQHLCPSAGGATQRSAVVSENLFGTQRGRNIDSFAQDSNSSLLSKSSLALCSLLFLLVWQT